MSAFPYKRIAVIGTTGSGKSTLAERLSQKLGIPYIEMDALYWEPGWQEADPYKFWDRVEDAIEPGAWVIVGNYRLVQPMIWDKAETIIWLDFPLYILLWRLFTRTIRQAWRREELWNGNRETLWRFLRFWSRDSLIYWLFKTYWMRKREYSVWLSLPGYEHLKVFHFKHPRELERWFASIGR